MNTPSPLIPQGSLSQMKGRSNVQLAVITIVAIHVVFFGGLLLQGCKRDTKMADGGSAAETNVIDTLSYGPIDTNAGMYYTSPTSLPADSSTIQTSAPIATTPDYSLSQPVNTGFDTTAASTSTEPAEPEREMKQYTVVSGDSFYKIAKANNTTVAALTRANPNIEPSRLRVGAKINVPVGEARPASASTTSGGAGDTTVYTVKSGDTLTRIAKKHGTTVSALRAANGLKVSRLLVGQKIKIPTVSKANATEASLREAAQTAGTLTNQ